MTVTTQHAIPMMFKRCTSDPRQLNFFRSPNTTSRRPKPPLPPSEPPGARVVSGNIMSYLSLKLEGRGWMEGFEAEGNEGGYIEGMGGGVVEVGHEVT